MVYIKEKRIPVQLVENDAFIKQGEVLQVNEEYATSTVVKKEIVYCDYGCSEQAFGYDESGRADCYEPKAHTHFPMHIKIIYE